MNIQSNIQESIHQTVLIPGYHLIELEFSRPVSEKILQDALLKIGFTNVIVDQSIIQSPVINIQSPKQVVDFWKQWAEWGTKEQELDQNSPVRYRFLGEIVSPLQLINTINVKWIFTHQLSFNPFEELNEKFDPFELERDTIYDIMFLARMRSKPTKESICETLAIMGFKPQKVIALKRNMRIPGRPNTSITRWYAVAKWDGPNSYISAEDPLFFQNVKGII